MRLHYVKKIPTLLMMSIVDVKSGRFMYQSGRVGDEAKKRKSPTKAGELGSLLPAEVRQLADIHITSHLTFLPTEGSLVGAFLPKTK